MEWERDCIKKRNRKSVEFGRKCRVRERWERVWEDYIKDKRWEGIEWTEEMQNIQGETGEGEMDDINRRLKREKRRRKV